MANLVVCLLAIGLASLLLTLVTHLAVLVVRRRRPSRTPTFPVSVLKPLKGVDTELYENLASFARQDYPAFELVFGCADPFDPAIAVARKLIRDFPHVPIRIVCGGAPIGMNPKVNNLVHIARAAAHTTWLISDADVRVGPDYLRAIAAELTDPSVGLVSSVIAAEADHTLASVVESLHVNTFIARSVCGADVLAGHPCVVGKAMLFRKKDLERVGGFVAVKDVLAEDYVLGQLFRDAGYKVALSSYAVHTVTPPRSLRELVSRHVRWSQMRRQLVPRLYWGEPLMMPAIWLSFALLALSLNPLGAGSWARPVAAFAAAGLIVLGVSDALLVRELTGRSFDPKYVFLAPLRDFTAWVIWAYAGFRRTVVWRGNSFLIGPGSTLTPYRHAQPDVALNDADGEGEVATLEA